MNRILSQWVTDHVDAPMLERNTGILATSVTDREPRVGDRERVQLGLAVSSGVAGANWVLNRLA